MIVLKNVLIMTGIFFLLIGLYLDKKQNNSEKARKLFLTGLVLAFLGGVVSIFTM